MVYKYGFQSYSDIYILKTNIHFFSILTTLFIIKINTAEIIPGGVKTLVQKKTQKPRSKIQKPKSKSQDPRPESQKHCVPF